MFVPNTGLGGINKGTDILSTNPMFRKTQSCTAINEPLLTISVFIKNKRLRATVDTAASVSFINSSAIHKLNCTMVPCQSTIRLANGYTRNVRGMLQNVSINALGRTESFDLIVTPLGSHEVILGIDFLKLYKPNINFDLMTVTAREEEVEEIENIHLPRRTSHDCEIKIIPGSECSELS